MKKGYVTAAAAWLASLAVIAIGYSIFQSRYVHITWSLSEFLDPLKFFTVGLPILALLSLCLALALFHRAVRLSKTLVQISFGILLVLSLTAMLSILGLLVAPAAWFAYQGIAKNEPPRTTEP
ncbi:hypothetical protein JP09_005305 [Dehalogenimonas etheniformans]|uniref:Uncharacterized protein n=1 Tax=Dehalogenimonas etheniformans TaxID=1536648 RepID=A0A2P5P7F9_9CHLR|nr:hypothetical protein JP09_005305 [Dehalogenimonas etheniformans]